MPARRCEEFSPPHEGYKKLKAALAELLNKKSGGGRPDPGRPDAQAHQGADAGSAGAADCASASASPAKRTDLRYDSKLADAIKKFQRANDLSVNGVFDNRTIRELNGPPHDRQIDIVLANMERWRWLPRDLGNAHVQVNLPEYSIARVHNGAQVWKTRIVIGKPDKRRRS